LDCSPTQAGQTLLGLAVPRRLGSLWSRRVGCRLPGPPLVWCWPTARVGLGWLGMARRARPHRGLPVDLGPGGRLAVTELLARVGGSSVAANCPCAAQGGCLVDMAVGADHRGRACVAVWWGEGPSSPLTALRQRPGHGWRSCWSRPTVWRHGRCVQAQRAQPTTQRCPAWRGSGTSWGWGHPRAATASSSLLERPRRSASRSNAAVGVGLAVGGGRAAAGSAPQ
jgi:hypothetical protein